MTDAKLVEYIKASRLSGRTDSEIRKTLTDIGWSETPVEEALTEADSQTHLASSETLGAGVQPDTATNPETLQTTPALATSSRGRLFLLLATVGLLILFAIVSGIVALRGISNPTTSTQNAPDRDKDRQSDIKSYAAALSKYYDAHGRYPATSGPNPDSTNASSLGIFNSTGPLKGLQSNFTKDPKNGQSLCQVNPSAADISCAYKYRVSADGKKFVLWAILENSYNNEGIYTVDSAGHHSLISSEPANP